MGLADRLPRAHWKLVAVLGTSFLFNQYDFAILGLALPQIQADLGVPEAEVGQLVAWTRLGLLLALPFALVADRWGRRAILLVTIAGFTTCTALTAFATTPASFAALQLLARAFIGAEEMVAIVMVAEELDARSRGFGLGMLAVFGALGHGLASVMFGMIDLLPYGWRALYGFGVLPLLLVFWFRRGIPETRRFRLRRRAGVWWEPLQRAALDYPARLVALVSTLIPTGFVVVTALSFAPKTLQEVHGYAPADVTALFIGGGVLVMLGYAVAGRLADQWGRKPVLCLGLLIFSLGAASFYNVSGYGVAVSWIAMMFSFVGVDLLLGALASELFPTSYRATASGLRAAVYTLGGAAGLVAEGWLFAVTENHAMAITTMLPVLAISAAVIGWFLPETAGRELETISPETSAVP